MSDQPSQNDLPSLARLRAAISPEGVAPFRVGIVIGPGFIPMDMVGVQTVFGLMPGARIYLIWKSLEPVEGFPGWWTIPTATFSDCPDLDVIAVPMLQPEVQNDREVIDFVAARGQQARYVIGVCNLNASTPLISLFDYCQVVRGTPFGRKIAAVTSFDAICIGSVLYANRKPPRAMPAKNAARNANIITPTSACTMSPM